MPTCHVGHGHGSVPVRVCAAGLRGASWIISRRRRLRWFRPVAAPTDRIGRAMERASGSGRRIGSTGAEWEPVRCGVDIGCALCSAGRQQLLVELDRLAVNRGRTRCTAAASASAGRDGMYCSEWRGIWAGHAWASLPRCHRACCCCGAAGDGQGRRGTDLKVKSEQGMFSKDGPCSCFCTGHRRFNLVSHLLICCSSFCDEYARISGS